MLERDYRSSAELKVFTDLARVFHSNQPYLIIRPNAIKNHRKLVYQYLLMLEGFVAFEVAEKYSNIPSITDTLSNSQEIMLIIYVSCIQKQLCT